MKSHAVVTSPSKPSEEDILNFLELQLNEIQRVINKYKQAMIPENQEISKNLFAWYVGRKIQLEQLIDILNGVPFEALTPIFDIQIKATFVNQE
jgi:molybdopterin-biosynthesis enzyme MoeA-like protein